MDNSFLYLFFSLFVIIGCLLWFWGFSQKQHIARSYSWLKTNARIVGLNYKIESDVDGDTYVNEIIYEYSVRGKLYKNGNIAFGYTANSEEKYHRRIYNILSTKTNIHIYYNPRNPQESVISKREGKGIYVTVSVGIFFIIWGLGFMILFALSNLNFTINNYLNLFVILIMIITFIIVFITNYHYINISSSKNDPLIEDLKQI